MCSFLRLGRRLAVVRANAAWRREKGLSFNIGVDGGIDFKTSAECAHAGADTFISGSTLFGRPNLGAAVRKMRKIVEAAAPKVQSAQRKAPMSQEPVLDRYVF